MNPEAEKQRVADLCWPVRDLLYETLFTGNRRGKTDTKLMSTKQNRTQNVDVMALWVSKGSSLQMMEWMCYSFQRNAGKLWHLRIYECVALGDRERKIRSEQEERMHVQDVRYVERVPVRYMRCTCRTDVHSCTRGVWYNINSKIRKFKTVILSENKWEKRENYNAT